MSMELNEQEHKGGVKSRTHNTCLVGEPVAVVIEGIATDLSLMDAKQLLAGLSEAVERVEKAEAALKGGSDSYHLMVVGNTRSGMSISATSKLGVGGVIEQMLMALPPEMRTLESANALMPRATGN